MNDQGETDMTHQLEEQAKQVGKVWVKNPYYEQAESPSWIGTFWDPEDDYGKVFLSLFEQLDTSVTVELACGHGRHAERIKHLCSKLILLDINASNIDVCMKRFAGQPVFEFHVCNGFSFEPLPENEFTCIFCYDAMVHFPAEVVFAYLRDAFRILQPGGKALFHHSNYDVDVSLAPMGGPSGRSYMAQAVFCNSAIECGFDILQSTVLDWGPAKNLDCVTLIRKPG